jgi:hypothetical protein
MRRRNLAFAAGLTVALSALCWAVPSATITETFDGTIDQASWRIGPDDEIVPAGGDPGAFLRNAKLTAAIPVVLNVTLPTEFNNFLGRYRIDGVSDLGVDLNIFAASDGVDDRPVSLGLISGDCELVLSEQAAPNSGTGWKSYRFHVPAWKRTMPEKWVAYGSCAGMPRDDAWNYAMGGQYVTAVHFYLGDPAGSYPVQTWTVGVDNASITKGKFGTPS